MGNKPKTNFEIYTASPETLAQILTSAFLWGLEAATQFSKEQILISVNNKEFIRDMLAYYIQLLNEPDPTYLGLAD